MKLAAALFFAILMTFVSVPARAESAPNTDCSVWEGVDCGALESSLKAGSHEFTQENLTDCQTCNPKNKKG